MRPGVVLRRRPTQPEATTYLDLEAMTAAAGGGGPGGAP
jgi:hypothetical protein